jgi:hypothetical protein
MDSGYGTVFQLLNSSLVDPDPDPDPNWIQIQWGPWIRIRIRNLDPAPVPGGQK